MTETTTSSDKPLAWYLRSLADHDTHRGWLGGDGAVLALCGARFIPKPTVRVAGEPPGRLVDGPPELALPPVPEQVCPENERVERELMALLERPAKEDPPLPEGVFHLMAADSDLTHRAHQRKITVCGASLGSSDLPPPCWGEGDEIGDRDHQPRFCEDCVSEALRWRAESELSTGAGTGSGGVR